MDPIAISVEYSHVPLPKDFSNTGVGAITFMAPGLLEILEVSYPAIGLPAHQQIHLTDNFTIVYSYDPDAAEERQLDLVISIAGRNIPFTDEDGLNYIGHLVGVYKEPVFIATLENSYKAVDKNETSSR